MHHTMERLKNGQDSARQVARALVESGHEQGTVMSLGMNFR